MIFHQYSTGGVLDSQEERRANLFAAFMLIPEVGKGETVSELSERFNVSGDLARLRLSAV